jgi:hypothetical protein
MFVRDAAFFPGFLKSLKVHAISRAEHLPLLLRLLKPQSHPILDGERQGNLDP